jgi:hypothetical protein
VNILVTGRGKSGSWRVRGEQLGKAIGADVIPNALDVAAHDVVVMVKRLRHDIIDRARRADVPLVWDVVDAWPQPEGNLWDRNACMAWLRSQIAMVKPQGIVAATQAMAMDCEAVLAEIKHTASVLYLEHHCRPGLERNPIREEVRRVGYEGGAYLGRWQPVLERECARRGWSFVVNPASLSELDIVVALREADGYAPRHWKSGVKLANAMGSGTPFIGSPEAGYIEMAVGVERFIETEADLGRALDRLTPAAERARCAGWLLTVAPTLEKVARKYRTWLETIGA